MQAQKTHTHARAHMYASPSPALLSVLKICFAGKISSALLSIPISIMLVFHEIIKVRFAGFKSRVNVHLKSPLHGSSESLPTTHLKLYFVSFQKRHKSLLRGFSNFALLRISNSTSLIFHNIAKARFAGFQIQRYQAP